MHFSDCILYGTGNTNQISVTTKQLNLGELTGTEDVTPAQEKAFFEGMGNSEVARAAQSWVFGNMSPEVIKKLQTRATYYANLALNVDNMKDRDLILEERGLDAEREKLNKKVEEQVTRELDAVDKKLTRELESAFEEGVDQGTVEYIDIMDSLALLKDDLDLPKDAVSASSVPLHPEVSGALEAGDLGKALQYIADTTLNNRVRNAAIKLAEVVGDTKVKVVENMDEAGNFDPKTNTISINAESGMNVHTVLHEMAHAATSATLVNKAHPMTKQLNNLFESVKDELDTTYGATNLDEFVAEAFSNPEFRMKLAGISPKGDKFTALDRFLAAVGNFLRKLFGGQTKPLSSALGQADALIDNILAPAPESRNSGKLLITSKEGPQAVADVANNYGKNLKKTAKAIKDAVSAEQFGQNFAEFLLRSGDKTSDIARTIALKTLPAQAFLTDVLGKLGINAGARLNELMLNQEADTNLQNRQLDAVLDKLQNWQKRNKEQVKAFNDVVNQSTIEQIDPTKPKTNYEGKEAEYDAIKKIYNSLDAEGKELYVDLRDTYKKLYERMQKAVVDRINTLEGADGTPLTDSEKNVLKDKVFGKLFEKGRIEPYFPLVRRGDYWLEYNAKVIGIDGKETTEVVVRAFESKGERRTAIEQLKEMPEVIKGKDGEPVFETNDDRKQVFSRGVPPTSFVGQTLSILEKANVSGEVKQEFLNLFIDSLPETAFAKSLKKRENKLGFEEDAVLAFRTKAYDIGRQVVGIEYAQKINAQVTKIEKQIDAQPGIKKETLAGILKNEVAEIAKFATNPPKNVYARMAQAGNRLAFLGTIGFNISSALVNMSQIPAVVFPFMAGKTSFKKATLNLKLGAKFFAGAGSESSIMVNGKQFKSRNNLGVPSIDNYYTIAEDGTLSVRGDIELSTEKNIDVHGKMISQKQFVEMMRPLVQEAMNQGQLNHSLFFDTQGLEQSGRVKYAGSGAYKKAMRAFETFNVWSATPFHTAERFNRQVTLSGTYLNELQRLNETNEKLPDNQKLTASEIEAEAVKEALHETQQTNGGAVLATAPPIAKYHIGRVAMMYKTFGMQMYYTQAKAFISSLKASGMSEEQRRIARRQFFGMQLSVLFLSGMQGITIYGMAAAITNMFLEDDDPDAETLTRNFLGEGLYKGGVNALLGLAGVEVDVASRIGLSNLILQSNRYNFDPSMEKTIVQTLGGPLYGYGSQIARGVDEILIKEDGDMQRGVENILPSAFRNMLKTARYADEGVLTRRKDPMMDDISPSELAAQFFGFAPAEYTLNQERNQTLKRIDKAVNEKRTNLLRRYYLALRVGDREGAVDTIDEIKKFNKRNPEVGISSDSIKKSIKQHKKTSATMYNGVTFSPKLRATLLDMGSDFE